VNHKPVLVGEAEECRLVVEAEVGESRMGVVEAEK
jgi:hypothetical protein